MMTLALASFVVVPAFGVTLVANTTINNGGSAGWAMFFDVSAGATALNVTSLTTASTAAANSAFSFEVFTRVNSGLGGPVGSGPGSSPAGWTSLGIANATQGGVASGISLDVDIPDIFVGSGSTVGVALRFIDAGPRYFGTGSPPLQTFTDGTLTLVTGDSRTAPFTTGGSFFSSRGLSGSLTYNTVPEPATMAVMAAGLGVLLRRRRRAAR